MPTTTSARTVDAEVATLRAQVSSLIAENARLYAQQNRDAGQLALLRVQTAQQAAALERFEGLATVHAGNITWNFQSLDGAWQSWTWPLQFYEQYALMQHPSQLLRLSTASGAIVTIPDMRPYVMPSFFEKTIVPLTAGRTAQEFVRETFNAKSHLVVYATNLWHENNLYQYPAETLTQGTGVCGDTTILLASMLLAGNAKAAYGMSLKVWYGDMTESGDIVPNAETVNHAFLEVDFQDGTQEFLETTASDFTTHIRVYGWSFAVAA